MRLVCPNCSAQYEVEDGLIPDEGRDVQCSNCGNTWFELPPPLAEAPAANLTGEAPADVAELASEEEYAPEPEPVAEAEPESESEPVAESEPAAAELASAEDDDGWDWPETRLVSPPQETPAPDVVEEPESERVIEPEKAAPAMRPADVADLDVLREEAEQEISKRRSEAAPIESQAEFGLAEPEERETPSRALRARMARLRGEDEGEAEPEPVEEDYQAPRRDLLPDIEEINSSLRPADGGREETISPEIIEERQRGFRLGFVASVGLAAIMVIAYAWAPAIASALPGTEQALIAYVDWANTARDALDGLIATASGGG